MPATGIYAFSIRKTTTWRNATQGFSNLYHYFLTNPTTTDLDNTLIALKDAERPVHDNTVNFIEGRAWGPVNADGSGGAMLSVQTFTQAGTKTTGTPFYKECAYLIKWPLGRYGTRNRPQFLRKWLHSQSTGLTATAGIDGSTDLGAATTALNTYEAAVSTLAVTGIGSPLQLQSASGHVPTGPATHFKYLEHRQYG